MRAPFIRIWTKNMKNTTHYRLDVAFVLLLLVVSLSCTIRNTQDKAADSSGGSGTGKKIRIGFAMDTLKEERWVRDRDAFRKRCDELNVDCIITIADNVAEKQANDVDNLLTQGIDVLVIAPHDATQAASMVDKAKAQSVPVISYDRLINSDKIDLYVSHQVPVIGRKIAEFALEKVPKGNYMMVYGASTDNNALIMKKAELQVLQPAIDKGDIKIVAENFMNDWKPEEALKFVENTLTRENNNIQAVICSNDGMAGGAISALEKQGLAGKVIVTGQDAQQEALRNIAEGKQTMTVYKPIIPLATAAVDAAVQLAKKLPPANTTTFRNDSINKDVPAILLEVTSVYKDNLMSTVIKDGFAAFDDVYANIPADQRPKHP
jgi:D-xylose transport system substrate-binding protein